MDIVIGLFLGSVLAAAAVYFWLSKKNALLEKTNIHLEAQVQIHQERIASSTQIKQDFEKIAAEVLKPASQNLSEKNAELLNPLATQIKSFREKIEGLSTEQGKDRSKLEEQIKNLAEAHKVTLEGAKKLTNALTYDNKQQGDWGEMILESILEDSGLEKDQQYHVQQSLKDDEGHSLRPDIIVHLPDNKDIIIDAKVSLKYYQEYVAGDAGAIVEHIKSIDNHIKNISLKSYENLAGVHTLDYIFVFFPIEASLLVALEQKPDLFNNALKKNVALVSPSTLMMSLKTINHIWNTERQNKNTEEIVRLAANMYDKLVGFVESLDSVGAQLNNATKSYDAAKSRLNDGRGNVFSIADKMKELGVKPKKELKK